MTKEQEKLIEGAMGYVITLARQYKSDILSTDDLISEGSMGVVKAAERYDASRGKPFVTFAAPYIRRSIEAAIQRHDANDGDPEVRSTDESLPRGSNNNYTLLNVLEDPTARRADDDAEEASLSDDLVSKMFVLSERERTVIARYYGIECERQTMAEIAEALGIRRERVRQVRNQALRNLRRAKK